MFKYVRYAIVICFVLSVYTYAADTPAPTQGIGEHSTICCSDGKHVRDDELAKWICDSIPKDQYGVCQVHDVKIMVNSCFGGGIIDDIQRIFGPSGCCPGVPWVAGSASGANETARGWGDDYVNKPSNKPKELGSNWTDALAGKAQSGTRSESGVLRDGHSSGNVKQDLEAARNKDDSGPNYDNLEHPVVASGNGGENIKWNEAGIKHRAVVAGGLQTDQRHHNNVKNMKEALEGIWGDGRLWEYIFGKDYDIVTLDGFTKDTLKNAIEKACEGLDSDTQLVLYIDDHGDTDFDLREYVDETFPLTAPFTLPESDPASPIFVNADVSSFHFTLNSGWEEAFNQVSLQPGDEAEPFIEICTANAIDQADWNIIFNGYPVTFPEPVLPPERKIPLMIPWQIINSEPVENELVIERTTPTATMELYCLNISSGRINEVLKPHDPFCGDDEHPILPADLNADCTVDLGDFAIFAQSWLDSTMVESY